MKSGDQFAKDINFQKVVFMHLNRTGQSLVEPLVFIANVEFFEMLMSPYIDDDYNTDIKSTMVRAAAIEQLDPLLRDGHDGISIKRATHNLRCLMKLAERKGLLLDKIGYGYGEDEEDETDEEL